MRVCLCVNNAICFSQFFGEIIIEYVYHTIIESILCKKSTWWVTSKTVLSLRAPMIHSCNKIEKIRNSSFIMETNNILTDNILFLIIFYSLVFLILKILHR